MVGLNALWLPILLSSVIVFVVSSIIHMMLPWHRNDYPRVPNEDKLMDALRPLAVPPGDYMIPRAGSMRELRTPQFAAKLEKGPVLMLTMMPNGPMSMRKSLVYWFLYSLVIGILAAYVAGRALPAGSQYLRVFQLAGVTAFIGYAVSIWQMSIWYHRAWSTTLKTTVDGLVYALLTGGTFGWLWPH